MGAPPPRGVCLSPRAIIPKDLDLENVEQPCPYVSRVPSECYPPVTGALRERVAPESAFPGLIPYAERGPGQTPPALNPLPK